MTHPTEPRVVELLPCPFCGGTKAVTFEDDEIGAWFAQCRSHCDASVSGTTEQRAIAAWNARTAAEAASRAEVERLRSLLGEIVPPRLIGESHTPYPEGKTIILMDWAWLKRARAALAATDGEG